MKYILTNYGKKHLLDLPGQLPVIFMRNNISRQKWEGKDFRHIIAFLADEMPKPGEEISGYGTILEVRTTDVTDKYSKSCGDGLSLYHECFI